MKNSILLILLLFLISFTSCSRSHVPDNTEIDELVKAGDLKTILELKAEYQEIFERAKVGKASTDEIIRMKNLHKILNYSAESIIKYGDSTFYSMYGGLFDAVSNRFYNNRYKDPNVITATPRDVFSVEDIDNISKNYRYLPPMWINVVVKDMLLQPSLYRLFLDEFARRRNMTEYKDKFLLTIAYERSMDMNPALGSLDHYSDSDFESLTENSTELPNLIIKYSDLLDDVKYKELKSLCRQIRPLMKIKYKYISAYKQYDEDYRKYAEARGELKRLANDNPYGMSSSTLDNANRLGVELRNTRSNAEYSEKELKQYIPSLNSYKELEKKIVKIVSGYASSSNLKSVLDSPL